MATISVCCRTGLLSSACAWACHVHVYVPFHFSDMFHFHIHRPRQALGLYIKLDQQPSLTCSENKIFKEQSTVLYIKTRRVVVSWTENMIKQTKKQKQKTNILPCTSPESIVPDPTLLISSLPSLTQSHALYSWTHTKACALLWPIKWRLKGWLWVKPKCNKYLSKPSEPNVKCNCCIVDVVFILFYHSYICEVGQVVQVRN